MGTMYLNCLAQTTRERRAYYKSLNLERDKRYFRIAMPYIHKATKKEIDAIVKALQDSATYTQAKKKVQEAILGNNDAWREAFSGLYQDIGILNGKRVTRELQAIKGVGADFEDVFLKKLPKHISKITAPKLKKLNIRSYAIVSNDIQRAIDDGSSIDELAAYIKEYIPQTYKNRERAIARTETCEAQGYSGQEAAKYTGLDLMKSWLAWIDDKTRSGHAEYNGETVEMDEPYVIDGDELMFPGDSSLGAGPENLVNCRCTETYEVKG